MIPLTPKTHIRAICLLCALSCCTVAIAQEKITYDDHVKPIFRQHCLACHDAGGKSGDLALDSYRDTIAGGAGGEVVASGDVDQSRLWRLVAHLDEPIMPPGQDKIPAEQLETIKVWIDGGLLENAGSKAMKRKKSAVAAFAPTADNRPEGEPAMPGGFYREPIIHPERAGVVGELTASPWAPVVAVAGQRQVLLYHTDTRALLAVVPFVVGTPEMVRFSRNGDLLLVAGGKGAALGVAHLWDVKTGRRIAELGDELDTYLAADISADHSLVALAGPRKRVQVFRTSDGSIAYEITKHTDWVTALEFSPNGQSLITADRSGGVHLWEAVTGRPVATLAGHQSPITGVSWRGDSNVVATASDDRTVRLWQADGTAIRQWEAHGGGVLDVAFTKSGQLVSSGRDKTVKLWDEAGKQLRQLTAMNDLALAVTSTHDNKLAFVSDWTGEVRAVATETGEVAGNLAANPPTLGMRISMAEQNIQQATAQIAPAESALAGAVSAVDNATKEIEAHNAEKAAAQQMLAQLQQAHQQHTAELKTHQEALSTADKVIEAAVAARQPIEAELKTQEELLAAVANQEGEDADAGAADQLRATIAATQERLAAADVAIESAKAAREPVAQALAKAEKAAEKAANQVAGQKKQIAKLEKQSQELPPLENLTAERERLKAELANKQTARQQAEAQLQSLKAEQAAYQVASEQLKQQIAERQAKSEELSKQLAGVNEQLADEQASVDAVRNEIEEMKKRLAAIEKAHQQLAEIAGKTRAAAEEIEEAIDAEAAERSQIERALADREAAEALQKKQSEAD